MKKETDEKVPIVYTGFCTDSENAKKTVRNNVISTRLTDNEYLHIARLSKNTGKSITRILREGISLWDEHKNAKTNADLVRNNDQVSGQ